MRRLLSALLALSCLITTVGAAGDRPGAPLGADTRAEDVLPLLRGTALVPMVCTGGVLLTLQTACRLAESAAVEEPEHSDPTGEDAQAYLQGFLDNLYLGRQVGHHPAFPPFTAQDYEYGLEAEAALFTYVYSFDDPTEEVMARTRALLAQAYQHASYAVSTGEPLENGGFTLQVQVRPIDVMTRVTDEDVFASWEATMKRFHVDQAAVNSMSDEEYYELDHYYAGLILDKVQDRLKSVGYRSAVTFTITLQRDEEGLYTLIPEELESLDAHIMPYFED